MNRNRASVLVSGAALLAFALLMTQAPGGAAAAQAKKAPVTKKAPAAKPRAPLTKAEVQKLWQPNNAELLLNEIRLRGLEFEPDESWLASLGNPEGMSAAVAELQKAIPPAPDPGEVEGGAPDLLERLKAAAQARDETALGQLLHPDLLANKALVYDLFDPAHYRSHVLGRFAPREHRTVGAQFFQLTASQVERLHYVMFATSRGKIVVRNIHTGPDVARLYLADELKLAESKLDVAFRALNDGDEAGLRSICTPGLVEHLAEIAGGGRLTRGAQLTVASVRPRISVPMDQKSIRPVARVNFNSPSGRQVQYDIDFERINNDLRIVRIRDLQSKVIAWDPDIDNYLNRRYGLPDGPRPVEPPQGMTEVLTFLPLRTIRAMAETALYASDASKLGLYAQELIESKPTSGEGYGLRATTYYLTSKWDEARRDAMNALGRDDGVVSFPVLHHKLLSSQALWPVMLGISRSKLTYTPIRGQTAGSPEEIDVSTVESRMASSSVLRGNRPFLNLRFRRGRDNESYNFAEYATMCPDGRSRIPHGLVQWAGTTICPAVNNVAVPTLVRADWDRALATVQQTIEDVRKAPAQKK